MSYLNIDVAFRRELPYLIDVALTSTLQGDHQSFDASRRGSRSGVTEVPTQLLTGHPQDQLWDGLAVDVPSLKLK